MNDQDCSRKLWQKGYELLPLIEAYTVGEDHLLDQRLLPYDCQSSIVHARLLAKLGVITPHELVQLENELNAIRTAAGQGLFPVRVTDEDCHTAIENRLVEKLGDTGKKIHTYRSRNDQVLAALRLFYRAELNELGRELTALQKSLQALSDRDGQVPLPGFTHTRKAMPASVALWCGAFFAGNADNQSMIQAVQNLLDQSPLGSGAGFGLPAEVDREWTAAELGFSRVQENALYCQNSRGKFEGALLNALSLVLLDLNRLATDLIWFTMPEFAYFRLPDQFCTGSSLMPQKKNPDVLELARAAYHQVTGWEFTVRQTVANLISGYHRDYQRTKEPVIRGIDLTRATVRVMTLVLEQVQVDEKKCRAAMTSELYATEQVYALVREGIPFREAYRQVAARLFEKTEKQ